MPTGTQKQNHIFEKIETFRIQLDIAKKEIEKRDEALETVSKNLLEV